MQATVFDQTELEGKINTSRARQRFLDHLAKNKEDGATDEDDECCILCRCSFTRGYITNCAHVFCEVSHVVIPSFHHRMGFKIDAICAALHECLDRKEGG